MSNANRANADTSPERLKELVEEHHPGSPPYETALEEIRRRKLEEHFQTLKKPHWTVIPNFWLTLVAAAAAMVSAGIATWMLIR